VDSLTFYFDRCFGKRFPEALLKMQTPFNVEYHHSPANNFPEEMADDDWLYHISLIRTRAPIGAARWT
jgi:hypothetical protein